MSKSLLKKWKGDRRVTYHFLDVLVLGTSGTRLEEGEPFLDREDGELAGDNALSSETLVDGLHEVVEGNRAGMDDVERARRLLVPHDVDDALGDTVHGDPGGGLISCIVSQEYGMLKIVCHSLRFVLEEHRERHLT